MTLLPWREHPSARAEYLAALQWYEEQEAGLGERVARELDEGVDFIRSWPKARSLYRDRQRIVEIRRKGVEVFPYGIVDLIRHNEVVVIAYAHDRRRPGYWRARLRNI